MADLTIDGETFKAEVEGDATRPALMLSHALGTDLSMWAGQMPALTRHFRVIRYDTRGHGGSGGGAAPISIGQLGRDALAILDALEIDKVHWLGLSMGGAIGLWLLANAPERIERAVLANTAPRIGSPEGWNARITVVLGDGMTEIAAATIERWFSPGFIAREPARVAAIYALLRDTSPESYARCCAALRDMDLRESLHGIGHDVLVVTGRDDPVVPAADIKAFVDGIAGARHVALAARHLSNVEAEAEFDAAVIAFLTAKPTRRRAVTTNKSVPPKPDPRKGAAAKTAAAKRGSATRRSNAARSPLKKAPAKRPAAKSATRTTAPAAAARPKKKAAATRRRQVAKTTATRRTSTKVVAKKRPTKALRKTVTARRPTPTATARSAVKATVKKTKPNKTAVKATKRTATKAATKKLPAARRKAVTKPRRPTGRRKP